MLRKCWHCREITDSADSVEYCMNLDPKFEIQGKIIDAIHVKVHETCVDGLNHNIQQMQEDLMAIELPEVW